MSNFFHSELAGNEIHVPHFRLYPDELSRLVDSPSGINIEPLTLEDVGKIARQDDNKSYWVLENLTPSWTSLAFVDVADVVVNVPSGLQPTYLRALANSAQNVNNVIPTAVVWDGAEISSEDMSASGSVITVDTDGVYSVTASIYHENNGLTRGIVQLSLGVNGTIMPVGSGQGGYTRSALGNDSQSTIHTLVNLAASDTVSIFSQQAGNAGTLNTLPDASVVTIFKIAGGFGFNSGGGGGSTVPTLDEGVITVSEPIGHNFTGPGVNVTNVNDIATINIPSTTVPAQDEGVVIAEEPSAFNFKGVGVNVTDIDNVATITIPGGSGSNIVPSGQPVFFRGIAAASGNFNVNVSTPVAVPWDGPSLKSENITHSASGSNPERIQVDLTGTYLLNTSLTYSVNGAVPNGVIAIQVGVNGAILTELGTGGGGLSRTGQGSMANHSTIVKLTASDYIEVFANGEGDQVDSNSLNLTPDRSNVTLIKINATSVGDGLGNQGGGGLAVKDEGNTIVADPNVINFVGSGVQVTDIGGVPTVDIPGSPLDIQDAAGSVLLPASALKFTGAGVNVAGVSGVATIDIQSGSAGPSGSIQYNDGAAAAGSNFHTWDENNRTETILGDMTQVGGTSGFPYAPNIVSTTTVGTNARYSVALGNYVYVVDQTLGDLRIFDVTDPVNPFQVNTTPLTGLGGCRGCDIGGRYLFVSDQNGNMHIVDVIDKSNPTLVSTTAIAGTPRGIKVNGSTVYVTGNDSAQGLISIDVTDVNNPVVLDTFNTTSAARTEFDIVGEIAYLPISVVDRIRLIDISDPSNMFEISNINPGGDIFAVKIQGRYAYASTEIDGEFQIYDISDPNNVSDTPIGAVQTAVGASNRVAEITGNFAYVADAFNDSLYVIDISDPTNPTQIGSINIGSNPVSISSIGRYAYIGDNTDDALRVVDLGAIQAQNLNVGNIDAGNISVRRDVKISNNISANGAVIGAGGIFSDGKASAAGTVLAGIGSNVVEVYEESDFPIVANVITPAPGVTYELKRPIFTDKTMTHPAGGGGFAPTVIRSSAKYQNTITSSGVGGTFLNTQGGQGQLVFQNIVINNAGSRIFADVNSLTNQTDCLTEFDDADVNSFDSGTIFENCIFNFNNASFIGSDGTWILSDIESNMKDAFRANFSDFAVPQFDIRSKDDITTTATFISIVDCKFSSHPLESFFLVHNNLIAGSTIRLRGVDVSPFTPGTGGFFKASITTTITALSNSPSSPSVKTLVSAAGHTVVAGDTVVLSGFATQTQYNQSYIASNVVASVSFDVTEVFIATDTGTATLNGLDQKDVKINSRDNPGQPDSVTIGSTHVKGNAATTTINTQNVFEDLDLGTALEGSNIERWSLTDTTTGELSYDGLEPFAGILIANIAASAGADNEFNYRAIKNGSTLPDDIVAVTQAKTDTQSTTLIVPISVVNGDTVRLQVANIDATTNITIEHLSLSIQ